LAILGTALSDPGSTGEQESMLMTIRHGLGQDTAGMRCVAHRHSAARRRQFHPTSRAQPTCAPGIAYLRADAAMIFSDSSVWLAAGTVPCRPSGTWWSSSACELRMWADMMAGEARRRPIAVSTLLQPACPGRRWRPTHDCVRCSAGLSPN